MALGEVRGRIIPALLLAMLVFLGGCDFLWNALSVQSLKKDVLAIVKKQGGTLKDPSLRMVGTTRVGICKFTASKKDIEALVTGLDLTEITREIMKEGEDPYDADLRYDKNGKLKTIIFTDKGALEEEKGRSGPGTLARRYSSSRNDEGCEGCYENQGREGVLIYMTPKYRPESLRMENGGAFDYFLLYYDVEGESGCIQVCYSYG